MGRKFSYAAAWLWPLHPQTVALDGRGPVETNRNLAAPGDGGHTRGDRGWRRENFRKRRLTITTLELLRKTLIEVHLPERTLATQVGVLRDKCETWIRLNP
jgi:hypothetical protein